MRSQVTGSDVSIVKVTVFTKHEMFLSPKLLLCNTPVSPMQIITLTTDLGTRDHYVGSVKGALLSAIPDALIIDISHDIEPFNILHAAFVLKNCYADFPKGTIHIIGVNSFHDSETGILVVKHEGYFFIGPDNGLFGLMWEEKMPAEIFKLKLNEEEMKSTLPLHDAYVRTTKEISARGNPSAIAEKINGFRVRVMAKPVISDQFLRGSIIYFDRFGNAVVNIQRNEFESLLNGKRFTIIFKRYSDIESISENYSAVEESEKLCFFNSSGYLELAINKGNAKQLLNLAQGDVVQIEFH
ncbi:MAG: S-adenosyl-l-methionine hydroxide adenosyltransferase family protein [Chitinophagales bacterium]